MTYEKKSVIELREIAKERKIKGISTLKKKELIETLEKYDQENYKEVKSKEETHGEHQGRKHYQKEFPKNIKSLDSGQKAHGILEVMPDGYGFIRCENYLPGENDIYVSPAQIRKFNLKTGDILTGAIRIKTQSEKFSALLFVESVNGYEPEMAARRQHFEDLTPIFPHERLGMETEKSSIPMRMVDLLSPVGKGQRGMIVSPPKTGKTTLLKQMAQSISKNYKDIKLIVLLIDERPEEVTDFKESIEGKFDYTLKDTFMGFHCGNTASSKLSFCEMKYQMIMARSLPIEVTNGTLEGDIKPGDITFYRLQSTADNKLRAYIAHGEVLPVATRSFGAIGVFAIPEMGRFYRHVLIEGGFPHHGAVAFGHFGKALFEVFKYIGVPVEEIGYNQPAGVRYPTENPWG